MKLLWIAIQTENLKFRRSKLLWIALLVCMIMPVMLGLVFSGLISSKAALQQPMDVPAYFDQLGIMISIAGLIGFGFIFSWLFGREYSDRTVKDLLALPVSRYAVAASKLIVAVLWCLIFALLLFGFGVAAVHVFPFNGWSTNTMIHSLGNYTVLSFMAICLSIPVAWMASVGRGYMSSLGFVVLTIVVAQISGAMGIAHYIPWAVPGLLSGAGGEEVSHLGLFSRLLPYLTGLTGILGTLGWWRYADQT
ncbi:ABC transporter permease [Paenibacillus sp. sgz500958]|uniref:ABC transporter permease n=1 Tax=Paenibacillus sp. sgz500958 TaxID=3242475 RepID=UPI0036D29AAD